METQGYDWGNAVQNELYHENWLQSTGNNQVIETGSLAY